MKKQCVYMITLLGLIFVSTLASAGNKPKLSLNPNSVQEVSQNNTIVFTAKVKKLQK
ncbi:MAG: hypothetical protein Q9N32_00930 [Gammaproteobacteria bacterium]|nr:hypothetical protein [Gammaproteobacteria bacterium]